ncbi:hypothetical protein [Hyphomicrobium sp.]|uniref:hypothetical protein n=1 Tax=Hyphomicrobium sp. TaxID=82 RepID=UPI002E31A0EA|nr:hypothetical protein [Hyphomicrobium sp.]HEX2841788.1 hypothetical protein [Hyphomicrobium sp.]
MTTALPVAYYLRDLSGDAERRGGRALAQGGVSESEALISDAHVRGVLEGRAAAQVEQDAVLGQLQASFDQKLATERQRWAAEQGAHLSALIATAFEDLEQRVAERVGSILKPFLSDSIRAKALEELSASLNLMLAKGEYAKIAISGPKDLLSEIEARLSQRHAGVTFVESDGADVVVYADGTIIETQIGAWTEAIQRGSP